MIPLQITGNWVCAIIKSIHVLLVSPMWVVPRIIWYILKFVSKLISFVLSGVSFNQSMLISPVRIMRHRLVEGCSSNLSNASIKHVLLACGGLYIAPTIIGAYFVLFFTKTLSISSLNKSSKFVSWVQF